jgi:hypothetical protein
MSRAPEQLATIASELAEIQYLTDEIYRLKDQRAAIVRTIRAGATDRELAQALQTTPRVIRYNFGPRKAFAKAGDDELQEA